MSSTCFLGNLKIPESASFSPRIYVPSIVIGLQGGLRLDTQMHEHLGVPQHQRGRPSPLGQLAFRVSLPLGLADTLDSFPCCSVLTHACTHIIRKEKEKCFLKLSEFARHLSGNVLERGLSSFFHLLPPMNVPLGLLGTEPTATPSVILKPLV